MPITQKERNLSMSKKIISIILALSLVFAGAFSVNAADVTTPVTEIPTIDEFLYTATTNTSISIKSGVITGTAFLLGYQGITTKVEVFVYLQQYKNGAWTNIGDWYQYFNNYYGGFSPQKSVSSGYSYRIKASYYANSGSSWENIISYSPSLYY